MPWTSNSGGNSPWGGGGGGNRPGGPWGGGGGGGGGGLPQGPDLDAIIRKAQETIRRYLPSGFGGGKVIGIGVALLVGVWLLSGFYRVQPDEQGVVLRFGAYHRTTTPGLNYALPMPIETVLTPRVTRINRIDVGFRSPVEGAPVRALPVSTATRDVPEESLMLTGDENIIDIDFAVFWRIREANDYLFNARNVEATIKSAAESVMRETIGRTPIQPALTEARAQIELAVRTGTQTVLDQYRGGVEITQVQLQKVDPPAAVIDAFRDVQAANANREQLRNEAESFRNDAIPRARGEAERVIQEAQGVRESQIARAKGEAARFESVLQAYSAAQDVTRVRLYIETMEQVLRGNSKILVDSRLQNIVPFLPLTEPEQPQRAAGAAPTAAQGAAAAAASLLQNPPRGGVR